MTVKKVSAILCSDIHLRETQPVCRTDEYWKTQIKKLEWLKNLQNKYKCTVLDAGDLFDNWKPSPSLLSIAIAYLPKKFFTVPGNHDLPQHNIDLYNKSGLCTLEYANSITCSFDHRLVLWNADIEFCHYGNIPSSTAARNKRMGVLVWHVMTYQGKSPWPGCKDLSAKEILKKYPNYKLIVTGHNHKSFVEEYKGRLLVNPGSLMRSEADQIDHKPTVYLWDSESNTIEPVEVPIKKGVVSRIHIESKEQKDERLNSFITKLNQNIEIGVSYAKNMESYLENNEVNKDTEKIIWECCDGN